MNKPNCPNHTIDWLKIGLGVGVLAILSGCVGYVDGGYSGTVFVPVPDVVVFGGGFDHDRDREVHEYSHRGESSRREAHPGGSYWNHR